MIWRSRKQILCFRTVAINFKISQRNWVLLKKLIFHQLVKKSLHRIEPNGSLPYSKKLAFFPLAEPDESSPRVIILVSKGQINFKIRNSQDDEYKTRFKRTYCLHLQVNIMRDNEWWSKHVLLYHFYHVLYLPEVVGSRFLWTFDKGQPIGDGVSS